MRSKNVWVVLAAVVLIAAVALLSALLPKSQPHQLTDQLIASSSPEPVLTPVPDEAPADSPEIRAYLLVTAQGYTQPVPLYDERDLTLRLGEHENIIHVTGSSVCMKSSNCENQDCVKQGIVTLENRDSRILSNMIICLPNQVVLELYSPEEFEALIASQMPSADAGTEAAK